MLCFYLSFYLFCSSPSAWKRYSSLPFFGRWRTWDRVSYSDQPTVTAKGFGGTGLFSHFLKLLGVEIKIKTKPVILPTHWEIFQWPPTLRYNKLQMEEYEVRRQIKSIWREVKCK